MKKTIVFLASLMCCIWASAQKNLVYEPVILTIDRQDGQYAAGETVNVYGQLTCDLDEELVCRVEANGKVLQRPSNVELNKDDKSLIYSASFDSPSAVQVYVYPKENNKEMAAVGFVVDAEGFRPGFEDPADFDKFWGKQL